MGKPAQDVEAITLFYTSAAEWKFLNAHTSNQADINPDFTNVTPLELAQAIAKRYPALLQQANFSCLQYVDWYSALLDSIGPQGSFHLQDEDYDALTDGYVKTYGPNGPSKFPLSPIY